MLGVILLAVVAGAFTGIVLPLFHFGATGPATAEMSGIIPDRAAVSRTIDIEVAIDNTGIASIRPVCVVAGFDAPVLVEHVTFQGLDRVPFRDGRACGGRLNRDETISVRLAVTPQTLGTVQVTVAPAEGSRTIGRDIHGTIEVAP